MFAWICDDSSVLPQHGHAAEEHWTNGSPSKSKVLIESSTISLCDSLDKGQRIRQGSDRLTDAISSQPSREITVNIAEQIVDPIVTQGFLGERRTSIVLSRGRVLFNEEDRDVREAGENVVQQGVEESRSGGGEGASIVQAGGGLWPVASVV